VNQFFSRGGELVVNQLSLITIRQWDNLRLGWYHLTQLLMGCTNKKFGH